MMGMMEAIHTRPSKPHPRRASDTAGKGTNKQLDKGVLLSGVAWSPDGRRLAYFGVLM
jgi:hypothetical protein